MGDTKPIRVVYVEDDPEMINLITMILAKRGYKIMGANGGREGLEMILKEIPDLILLDLMMPDVDGWNLYQQVKSNPTTSQIPVIVITAKSQPIDRVLGLHIAKVDDYICKPFLPKELIQSIEKVLGTQVD